MGVRPQHISYSSLLYELLHRVRVFKRYHNSNTKMQDRLQVFPCMDIDFHHHCLLNEAFIQPLFLVGVALGGGR